MKIFLKILASLLLLFNGIGAIYGGWNLMAYPDGSSIQLSMDWLKHAPFNDYFIPGVILFFVNGMLSLFIFITLLLRFSNYTWLVMMQGALLTGWIVIQILMVQTTYFLHFIMGAVGLGLIITGAVLHRMEANEKLKRSPGFPLRSGNVT